MQQHTGQHLISAIFEVDFATPTRSWWMSEREPSVQACQVEVEPPDGSLSVETLQRAESLANEAIRSRADVKVTYHQRDDPKLDEVTHLSANY